MNSYAARPEGPGRGLRVASCQVGMDLKLNCTPHARLPLRCRALRAELGLPGSGTSSSGAAGTNVPAPLPGAADVPYMQTVKKSVSVPQGQPVASPFQPHQG